MAKSLQYVRVVTGAKVQQLAQLNMLYDHEEMNFFSSISIQSGHKSLVDRPMMLVTHSKGFCTLKV